MEPEHVKEVNQPEDKQEDDKTFHEGKNPDFSSAAPVSSSSSSSALSKSDIGEKNPFDDMASQSKFDGSLSPVPEHLSSPDFMAQTSPWSMISASPPPGHLSSQLLTDFPDFSDYNVGQSDGYDPNRIPASVFSSKHTNTSEWSTNSNESLFSIHTGKSGELPRLDEWNSSQSNNPFVSEAKYNEFSSLPTVMEEVPAHEEGSVKSSRSSRLDKGDSNNSIKSATGGLIVGNHAKAKMSPAVATKAPECRAPPVDNPPRLSCESGVSSSSFAFPILVTDVGKISSKNGVTEKPEKPQLQEQAPTETPKSSTRKRCCSFCWPSSC